VRADRDHAAEPSGSAREPATAVTSTPVGRIESAADVLALQRRIGNAATRRWLARQEAAADPLEANWTNICATQVPRPAGAPPQAVPGDHPLIHTVAGPCLTHWAGGYFWYVTYQLRHETPVSGHIIQELWQQGSGGSSEHFWEYWEVPANSREPTGRTATPPEEEPRRLPYDDRYRHGVLPNRPHDRQGWYRHIGIAKFYPGPLPPEFTPPHRQTWVMPTGWTGTGTRHDCYAEWDRRPGHPRRLGLIAVAGTDEYRAGDAVRGVTP
jgi:hypothetical protein